MASNDTQHTGLATTVDDTVANDGNLLKSEISETEDETKSTSTCVSISNNNNNNNNDEQDQYHIMGVETLDNDNDGSQGGYEDYEDSESSYASYRDDDEEYMYWGWDKENLPPVPSWVYEEFDDEGHSTDDISQLCFNEDTNQTNQSTPNDSPQMQQNVSLGSEKESAFFSEEYAGVRRRIEWMVKRCMKDRDAYVTERKLEAFYLARSQDLSDQVAVVMVSQAAARAKAHWDIDFQSQCADRFEFRQKFDAQLKAAGEEERRQSEIKEEETISQAKAEALAKARLSNASEEETLRLMNEAARIAVEKIRADFEKSLRETRRKANYLIDKARRSHPEWFIDADD